MICYILLVWSTEPDYLVDDALRWVTKGISGSGRYSPEIPPSENPPGGDPARSVLKATIWKLPLTRTPDPISPTRQGSDPNRPTGVTYGPFSLGGGGQSPGKVSRGLSPVTDKGNSVSTSLPCRHFLSKILIGHLHAPSQNLLISVLIFNSIHFLVLPLRNRTAIYGMHAFICFDQIQFSA